MKLSTAEAIVSKFDQCDIEAHAIPLPTCCEWVVEVITESVTYRITDEIRMVELERIVANAQGL